MTDRQFRRIKEGDRWVALRKLENQPLSAPILNPDVPATDNESTDFGLLRQIHLRHDVLGGNRHT